MVRRANERNGIMARTRRIKRDGDAHYHLMSRTNDRRFLFSKGRVKGEIVSLLRRAAAFSGVRLEAWCVMDNHFHIVCEVARPDGAVPETEVIRRIGILKGGRFASELAEHWSNLRSCGMDSVVDAVLDGWRARMGFAGCVPDGSVCVAWVEKGGVRHGGLMTVDPPARWLGRPVAGRLMLRCGAIRVGDPLDLESIL